MRKKECKDINRKDQSCDFSRIIQSEEHIMDVGDDAASSTYKRLNHDEVFGFIRGTLKSK